MASAKSIPEEEFKQSVVTKYTDVIAKKVEGKVLGCSDEWFADAANLIESRPVIRDATRFTEKGAWYDGWETRRHNKEEADWVVFRFGVSSAKLIGAEVDTAFFNGNHAPHISVEAVFSESDSIPEDAWEPVIPKMECGPSAKYFFVRPELTPKAYTHARLRMYPDGGIARFRLYGEVVPVLPAKDVVLDAALVKNGGVAVNWSDQHFGTAGNLLLPGRGHDMSDGWETKRSRTKGHVDWVIIKLGVPINVEEFIVDTAHYKGNFPQKIVLKGTYSEKEPLFDSDWTELVGETETGPHKEHFYKVEPHKINYVLLVIIPDGGVKRLRVLGKQA